MRRPVIAGNWKMYKTIAEAVDFIEKIKPLAAQAGHCEVIVAPPFTALAAAAAAAKGSKVSVAAQNCHWDKEGAHTGDISTGMLLTPDAPMSSSGIPSAGMTAAKRTSR